MRRQSLRAPAFLSAAPASRVVISAKARRMGQEGRGRCCCNNSNRPTGTMRVRESADAPCRTGGVCDA